MKKEPEIGYKVNRILTTAFAIEELTPAEIERIFSEKNSLKTLLNVNLNIDKGLSVISFEIESTLSDLKTDTELIHHKGKTVFGVKGLDKLYNKKTESFDLPDNLIVQMFSIAYTHARALLFTALSPTVYKNKFILPVIDPTEILIKV